MPVEIRELQITTVVEEVGHQAPATYTNPDQPGHTDDIVALVVERVMEILKQKTER